MEHSLNTGGIRLENGNETGQGWPRLHQDNVGYVMRGGVKTRVKRLPSTIFLFMKLANWIKKI